MGAQYNHSVFKNGRIRQSQKNMVTDAAHTRQGSCFEDAKRTVSEACDTGLLRR